MFEWEEDLVLPLHATGEARGDTNGDDIAIAGDARQSFTVAADGSSLASIGGGGTLPTTHHEACVVGATGLNAHLPIGLRLGLGTKGKRKKNAVMPQQ